jgi:hypothetical protein
MDLSTGIFWLGALALFGIAYWRTSSFGGSGRNRDGRASRWRLSLDP